jgi:uncharacterized protein DUF3883
MSTRDKLILAGLYLSKYDAAGLKALGFDTFIEAFNVLAYGLGARPASIKNYRDEFDPLFPNQRKGWHKRPRRSHCVDIYKHYEPLDFLSFTALIRSFFEDKPIAEQDRIPETEPERSTFAQRLATGLAAERYFESIYEEIPDFEGLALENMTALGCGYDFRLSGKMREVELAVEVKGMMEQSGTISLTPKEHTTAKSLSDRFYLFVVRNFREQPTHIIFRDPLAGTLKFTKREKVIIQTSWSTSI